MKIKKIWFNWSFNYQAGENYSIYEVGKKNVVSIIEYQGIENNPYFCLVNFENGEAEKLFNINRIFYEME
jgi:hypothetical protein